MLQDVPIEQGDLSGLIGAVLVLYADRALGPEGVKAVIDRVGAEPVLSLVENWEEWVDFEVVLATAIAVAELCHEPDIGRRTGEELFRVLQERGLLRLPPHVPLVEVFPEVVESLNTATELRHSTVVECDERMARIEVITEDAGRTKFLCRALLGFFSLIPSLTHAIGAAVETRCIHRGDELCEYRIRWRTTSDPVPGHDPWSDRVARLQQWAVGLASEGAGHAPEALEAAELLDEVRRHALRDPLTGVGNRAALELRADEERRRRDGRLDGLTLVFVDLDGFKAINDTHGHAVGDDLLVQLGARLEGVVRSSDLVARLGGDEFVVLFSDVDTDGVDRLLRKVRGVFATPYRVGTGAHVLSGSVGVSRAPEHGQTFSDLLHHADSAMYRVKRARQQPDRVWF
jgi:diguanylate cyclase (GGDEF)-like protein